MSRMVLHQTNLASNKATNYALYCRKSYNKVLELGPYDGTDSIFLVKKCKFLTAIEGNQTNFDCTLNKIKQKRITNISLVLGNLETFDLKQLGTFDCVWASGIIYHMPRPVELIKQIASISRECFGWTHLACEEKVTGLRDNYAGKEWAEYPDHPSGLSGLSTESWWLTPDAFIKVWTDLGWKCTFTTLPSPHPNGDLAAQFWTRKQ